MPFTSRTDTTEPIVYTIPIDRRAARGERQRRLFALTRERIRLRRAMLHAWRVVRKLRAAGPDYHEFVAQARERAMVLTDRLDELDDTVAQIITRTTFHPRRPK